MLKRGFLIFLFFALFSGMAYASEWVVERATKNVSVSADGTAWRDVTAGDAIPNAGWVRTGPRSRVILAKGSERIMYRENTLAAISVSQPTGKKTKVTQKRGSILLSVKKRRTQHTSVVTPHLAAVVKGTVFEVTVGRAQSRVRVDQGLVEVSDGGRSVDVPKGQAARVGATSTSIEVTEATETSVTPNGQVGLELSATMSEGNSSNAGENGNGNAGETGNANGSANEKSGGSGNGNTGGNSNAGGNGKGNSGG